MSNVPNDQFVDSLKTSGDYTHGGATYGGNLGAQLGQVPVRGSDEPDAHFQQRQATFDWATKQNGSGS